MDCISVTCIQYYSVEISLQKMAKLDTVQLVGEEGKNCKQVDLHGGVIFIILTSACVRLCLCYALRPEEYNMCVMCSTPEEYFQVVCVRCKSKILPPNMGTYEVIILIAPMS